MKRVTILLPSQDCNGRPLGIVRRASLVQHVVDDFTCWFGGATAEEVEGYYVGSNGLTDEHITKVWSVACGVDDETAIEHVSLQAQFIATWYNQESVLWLAEDVQAGFEVGK